MELRIKRDEFYMNFRDISHETTNGLTFLVKSTPRKHAHAKCQKNCNKTSLAKKWSNNLFLNSAFTIEMGNSLNCDKSFWKF